MAVTEIITYVRTRIDLEIRRVFLILHACVGVLNSTRSVFVERLQMTHIILAAQTYLYRQFIPEAVAVRDIQRMVLRHAVEVRVVRE